MKLKLCIKKMGKRKKFPVKLFEAINNKDNSSIISWSEDGTRIIIKDKDKLAKLTRDARSSKSGSEADSNSVPLSESESELKSISESDNESESECKAKGVSKKKAESKKVKAFIRQLNKYGFQKHISRKRENMSYAIYSFKDFYKNQSEEKIKAMKPVDIKQILQQIKENKNVEEKFQNYIELLNNSKNKIKYLNFNL